jgi:hypothetical protein
VSRPDRFILVERIRYPLGRRLGGLQSRSVRGGKEQGSLPLHGIKLVCPARYLVTILTEPSHFLMCYMYMYYSSESWDYV